jgi:hypothetical protein
MKKIAIAVFITSFLLLRPYAMQRDGLWYSGDDQDYLSHATAIVFGQFPSYEKEYLTIVKEYPQSSIGCGLITLPFVWGFSLFDWMAGSSIVQRRTAENIPGSWTQFGFVFGSYFYFVLAIFLLFRGLRYHVQERYAFLTVVLTVLCQGLPLFALRRPIFSHAAEFFIQSLFVFLFFRNCASEKRYLHCLWHYLILGCLSALIFLTRYNDIGFALVWPLIFIWQSDFSGSSRKRWSGIIVTILSFTGMLAIFKIWPEMYNQFHPYQWAKDYLITQTTWVGWLQRIGHILWGLDWGLIYTAPYILLGFAAALTLKYPNRQYYLCLLAALLINVYIIIVWGSQGGWYGYRYLIASAVPLFVLPVALLMKNVEDIFRQKLTLLWVVIAVLPALSMLFFEGNDTSLTLHVIPQAFGRSDWGNDAYQVAVWQTAMDLHAIGQPLFKGGMYYIVYLFQAVGLPLDIDKIRMAEKYPYFEWKILVRTMILYMTPFLVWFIFRMKRAGKTKFE